MTTEERNAVLEEVAVMLDQKAESCRVKYQHTQRLEYIGVTYANAAKMVRCLKDDSEE